MRPPDRFHCVVFTSVKLKHFEKFQDTTEALAGNDILSINSDICVVCDAFLCPI